MTGAAVVLAARIPVLSQTGCIVVERDPFDVHLGQALLSTVPICLVLALLLGILSAIKYRRRGFGFDGIVFVIPLSAGLLAAVAIALVLAVKESLK